MPPALNQGGVTSVLLGRLPLMNTRGDLKTLQAQPWVGSARMGMGGRWAEQAPATRVLGGGGLHRHTSLKNTQNFTVPPQAPSAPTWGPHPRQGLCSRDHCLSTGQSPWRHLQAALQLPSQGVGLQKSRAVSVVRSCTWGLRAATLVPDVVPTSLPATMEANRLHSWGACR